MAAKAATEKPGERPTSKVLFRDAPIDPASIKADSREVDLSFASEQPVQRYDWDNGGFYMEILDHGSPRSADFSRLNAGGALLREHDRRNQVGVVVRGSAKIESDRKSRCTVKFSRSPAGEQEFMDVKDGIRTLVSFGYETGKEISREKKDGVEFRRYEWTPFEVSTVSIPADTTVGVGRAEGTQQVDSSPEVLDVDDIAKNLNPEQKKKMRTLLLDPAVAGAAGGGPATPAVDPAIAQRTVTEAVDKAEKAQVKRWQDILDSLEGYEKDHGTKDDGKLAGELRKLATKCFKDGASIGEFQRQAMEQVIKAKPAKPILMADCASDEDAKRYSLLRGIQSALKHRMAGKEAIPDGLEGEVHQQMIRSAADEGGLGYEPSGFQVPHDANLRPGSLTRHDRRHLSRDMQATVFNAGGAFVPTQLVVPIIELLRNRLILEKAGIRTMAGLQGNIVIPRQEAAATAVSVSEIGALAASQQILGQIAMQPRRVGAMQAYSKQFVMQSTPDAEAFMRDDLFKVIALRWDYLGLNGQGAANEPLGIINTPGVASILFGATPTYIKMVSMETAIRAANVTDPLCYLSTSTVKGTLKTVAEALTGATTVGGAQNAIWKGQGDGDGTVNGYPAYDTQQVPGNLVILGAFSQLILGLWGGFDVVVDYFTKKANVEVEIAINTWGDFAVRHPQAFCVSADAGNQ